MILNKRIILDQKGEELLWIADSIQYEVITGSHAYGCNMPESDVDFYGFFIPKEVYLFPSKYGYISGFNKDIPKIENLIFKPFPYKKSEAEGQMFSIIKYFRLCADNNPNMIDTLFIPDHLITYRTPVGRKVRENRHLFVSKKCFHTFKGYAYSQLKKIRTKNPIGKRKKLIEQFGFDVKFASHLVRLLYECEQLLLTGEMDLQRNKEELKSIRRGEWSLAKVEDFFEIKVKHLEELYKTSDLPYAADEEKLTDLLRDCIHEGLSREGMQVDEVNEELLLQLFSIQDSLRKCFKLL